MKSYEVMYIIKPFAQDRIQSVIDKYTRLIEANDGVVAKVDMWGMKRLAFEIQDLSEGYYVLVTFNAEQPCVKELDRVMKLDQDNVLRYMIVRK